MSDCRARSALQSFENTLAFGPGWAQRLEADPGQIGGRSDASGGPPQYRYGRAGQLVRTGLLLILVKSYKNKFDSLPRSMYDGFHNPAQGKPNMPDQRLNSRKPIISLRLDRVTTDKLARDGELSALRAHKWDCGKGYQGR
jgi:hypothetical protein